MDSIGFSVILAQAGIQYSTAASIFYWIPACARMTKRKNGGRFPIELITL